MDRLRPTGGGDDEKGGRSRQSRQLGEWDEFNEPYPWCSDGTGPCCFRPGPDMSVQGDPIEGNFVVHTSPGSSQPPAELTLGAPVAPAGVPQLPAPIQLLSPCSLKAPPPKITLGDSRLCSDGEGAWAAVRTKARCPFLFSAAPRLGRWGPLEFPQ